MRRTHRKKLEVLTGGCRFCGETTESVLDEHHIIFQSKGGLDIPGNRVFACSNCHRKVHAGLIVIDRWYSTTSGDRLHCWLEGRECYL